MYHFSSDDIEKKYQPILNRAIATIFSSEFEVELLKIKGFFNTDVSSSEILKMLRNSHSSNAVLQRMGSKRLLPWYRNTTAETNGIIVELNPKFMGRADKKQANTLVHEWLHTQGFSHIWNNPRRYPQILKSPNYVIGELVERLYDFSI